MTIAELAADAHHYLTHITTLCERGDDTIVALKDESPDWVHDLVREAHGDMFPDDWRYEAIRAALRCIADDGDPDDNAGEYADCMVDVYTSDRLAWLASHLDRAMYCDDAIAEMGGAELGTIERIAYGQYAEASEVYHCVLTSLRDREAAL